MSNRTLTVKRIWDDADIVEVRCTVDTPDFRGTATAYLAHGRLEEFSAQLTEFLKTCKGRVQLSSGFNDGTKAVCFDV